MRKKICAVLAVAVLSAGNCNFISTALAEELPSEQVVKMADSQTVSPGIVESVSETALSDGVTELSVGEEKFDVWIEGGETANEREMLQALSKEKTQLKLTKIERSDGFQVVSQGTASAISEVHFKFQDLTFQQYEGGLTLAFGVESGALEYVLDPAWAMDESGNSLKTYYEVNDGVLTQVVVGAPTDGVVFADPYFRDVQSDGRKVGQDMVFSPQETAGVVGNGAVCATVAGRFGWPGWVIAIGCAGASKVAGDALYQNRCLAIRALGSPYAPNLMFPIVVDC